MVYHGKKITYEDHQRKIEIYASRLRQARFSDKILIEYAPHITAGLVFSSSLYFWKISRRAFRLYKYGVFRWATLSAALLPTTFAGYMSHNELITKNLTQPYRREGHLRYGIRSLLAHQIGNAYSFIMCFGMSFVAAHHAGILVVPDRFWADKESRTITKNFLIKALGPHSRSILAALVMTSLGAFFIGYAEYGQSRKFMSTTVDNIVNSNWDDNKFS